MTGTRRRAGKQGRTAEPAGARAGLGAPLVAVRPDGADAGAVFSALASTGRFVRDSRLGAILHPGKISLREVSEGESLHVCIGERNTISVHIDRVSPLADTKSGRARRYSPVRVIAHNAGILADCVRLLVGRRFGQQRCQLECERVDDDGPESAEVVLSPRLGPQLQPPRGGAPSPAGAPAVTGAAHPAPLTAFEPAPGPRCSAH